MTRYGATYGARHFFTLSGPRGARRAPQPRQSEKEPGTASVTSTLRVTSTPRGTSSIRLTTTARMTPAPSPFSLQDPAQGLGRPRPSPCAGYALRSTRRMPLRPSPFALLLCLALLAVPACRTHCTDTPPTDAGWITLFDGHTLDGWVTTGGRYDGNAAWTIEDGAITGRQNPAREGGLLYTTTPYTDFELTLDVRLDEPFDSGVFLRMTPRAPGHDLKGAQVTLDLCPDGELGAIYADGFLQHNPTGRRLWRSGAWNHLTIRCTGPDQHILASINGAPLVEHRLAPDTPGFAPTGLIGLQVHGQRDDPPGNKVQFKNIRLRDLAPTPATAFTDDGDDHLSLTPWGAAQGWRALFDDPTLSAWTPLRGTGQLSTSGFSLRDGTLALLATGDSDTLATREDFQDFELRLDFKLDELANSGLFLRAARDGTNPAFSGAEIQLLDDFHWEARTNTQLKPWQHTASLYGAVASGEPAAVHQLGEWNTLEIRWQGPHLTTRLNGRELYSVDTTTLHPEQGPPFSQRAPRGFLGIQRHADQAAGEAYAWFRNAFVRPL